MLAVLQRMWGLLDATVARRWSFIVARLHECRLESAVLYKSDGMQCGAIRVVVVPCQVVGLTYFALDTRDGPRTSPLAKTTRPSDPD